MRFRITAGEIASALDWIPHPSTVQTDKLEVALRESSAHFERYPDVDVQKLEERALTSEKSPDGGLWYLKGVTGFKIED